MEVDPNATVIGPTNPPVLSPLSGTNKAIVKAMYPRKVWFEERHPPIFYAQPSNSNIRHIILVTQPERDQLHLDLHRVLEIITISTRQLLSTQVMVMY